MASQARRPNSDLGRPAIDWSEAFLFYASLPPEQRSYARVAAEFGVSVRTVERHGRVEKWRQRMREIQAQAAREADKKLGRAWAERIADFEKLIEATCISYAQQLSGGRVRVTASDLVGLVKISLQLRGEPSERVELVASSDEWLALRGQILQALAAYPEAREALSRAIEVATDG